VLGAPVRATASGTSSVSTSAHCGAAVATLIRRVPRERPRQVTLVVTVRPTVVLLHRPLAAELDLGLNEGLSDQSTHIHGLLLWLFPADDSTMPV
jgi:hypothetical protein